MCRDGGTTSIKAQREALLGAKSNHFPRAQTFRSVAKDSISTSLYPKKRTNAPDYPETVLPSLPLNPWENFKPKLPDIWELVPADLSPFGGASTCPGQSVMTLPHSSWFFSVFAMFALIDSTISAGQDAVSFVAWPCGNLALRAENQMV